ncbi:MAG: Lrp/AsnC family transcriptional regulator [Acidimicrobiales bacterium]
MDELDDIDRQMIDELRRDGRVSVPVLAERLGIARATAYTRFDRLVDDGVIRGFAATVDPARLGLRMTALVMVDVAQDKWREAQTDLAAIDAVDWVGLATGQFDIVLRVRCADLDELRDVVLVQLHAVPAVRSAQTVVLLDEIDPGERRR